jgi:hypothetical protein
VGSGYTVEGQKTGEEKFGGLQIEIIPSFESGLRLWTPAPGHHSTTAESFDWSEVLDEHKTSNELGFKPGDRIRSHPPNPTHAESPEISELTGVDSKEDTRVWVRRMQ